MAAILGIIITECLFHLPFREVLIIIIKTLNKSLKIIRSRNISDHWKQLVILRYSYIILAKTLKLAFCLLIILTAIIIIVFFNNDFVNFVIRPSGFVLITIVSLGYLMVRRNLFKSKYSLLIKILHYVALGNSYIAEVSFDIEQASQKHDFSSILGKKHVFIAGLARAGTTILMRRFHSTNHFRSLTYRDMPFVLMPCIWARISSVSKVQMSKVGRAHGDGLLVDYDSPEAFEEVFWRIFSGDRYIKPDKLIPLTADSELIDKFRLYVASVLCTEGRNNKLCYLSKNNNNILRLPVIQRAFPEALIIIPFRDPVQQAGSLLQIHERFVELQKSDKFICQYMQWLVHHEFGQDHRPFCFDDGKLDYIDLNEINYWLQLWMNTYTWLYRNASPEIIFLSYESLCTKTDDIWSELSDLAGISKETQNADIISFRSRPINGAIDENLLNGAKDLYSLLMKKESSVFRG